MGRPPYTRKQRIRSFWSRVVKKGSDDCWLWTGGSVAPPGRPSNRYGMFYTKKGHIYAHRFSYQLNVGNIPEGLRVLHRCDNGMCVNPSHLFLGTHADNMTDMVKKGRSARKLSDEQVRTIRKKHERLIQEMSSEQAQHKLAARYSVHKYTIYQIVRGTRRQQV